MADPPNKYRCLKLPITSILLTDNDAEQNLIVLQNAILRANAITSKTYFLMRIWLLHKYHSNQEIPELTQDTIAMCMKSILLPSSGPKPQCNNAVLLQEFLQLHSFPLEDGSNLSANTNGMLISTRNARKIQW